MTQALDGFDDDVRTQLGAMRSDANGRAEVSAEALRAVLLRLQQLTGQVRRLTWVSLASLVGVGVVLLRDLL